MAQRSAVWWGGGEGQKGRRQALVFSLTLEGSMEVCGRFVNSNMIMELLCQAGETGREGGGRGWGGEGK